MRKMLLLILPLLSIVRVNAQTETSYPLNAWLGKGEFVITGKVLNKPSTMKSWQLAVTDYISNKGHEIPIEEDGSFHLALPITDVQDIYLYLGDAITIFSFPGDTIHITFDSGKPIESLTITGTTAARNLELNLCLEIYRNFRKRHIELSSLIRNKEKSRDEKLIILNDYYNQKTDFIDHFVSENGSFPFLRKFQDETYFQVAQIAAFIDGRNPSANKLLPEIICKYPRLSFTSIKDNGNGKRDTTQTTISPYEVLDYNIFRTVPNYQTFLQNYINSQRKKTFSWTQGYPEPEVSRPIQSHPSLSERYSSGKNLLSSIPPIRDWYLSDLVNNALTFNPIMEVDSLYQDFLNICENEDYLSILEPVYQQALKLAPGQPAPDFELKDPEGKSIRLSDLRGKIVYMDFWGMGCGPCIYEFTHSKEEFYQKYNNEDIVLVYISVDSNEEQWKKGIEKYKLEGINLIAKGWEKNPVCQMYNVKGIPHYVLIDKEGIIVNNKCNRPSIMLREGKNSDLEKTLARYK